MLCPVAEPQLALWARAYIVPERETKAGELWLAACEPSLWHPTMRGPQRECGNSDAQGPATQSRGLAAQNSSLTSYCNSSSERQGSRAGNMS